MKRTIILGAVLLALSIMLGLLPLYADEAADSYEILKNELVRNGVSQKEVEGMRGSLKNMIQYGANRDDIKNTVLDLKRKKLSSDEIKNSVDSMGALVKEGENAKEAGNIVSRAAHQAKMQGLKGKDLANKVHDAIRVRKQDKDFLKAQKEKRTRELKEKEEKMKIRKEKLEKEKKERTEKLKMERSGAGSGGKKSKSR